MSRSRVTRVIQLTFAQMGLKRGKRACVALLLESSELPGAAWKSHSPITTRSGALGGHDAIAKRARKQRRAAAWKDFAQLHSSRKVKIKVWPLASFADAESRVASFYRVMREQLQENDKTVEVPLGPDYDSNRCDQAQGFAYMFDPGKGKNQTFRILISRVDETIFSVSCSSDGDGWTWDEVFAIASLQRARILTRREKS